MIDWIHAVVASPKPLGFFVTDSCRVFSALPGNEGSSTIHDDFLTETCDGTMAEALPALQAWEAYFTPTNRYRERTELGTARYGHHLPPDIAEIELTRCTLEELLATTGVTWESLHTYAGHCKIIWTGHDDYLSRPFVVPRHLPFKYYTVEHYYSSSNRDFVSTNDHRIGDFLVGLLVKSQQTDDCWLVSFSTSAAYGLLDIYGPLD